MSVRPITIIGHRALEQRTKKVREVTEDLRTLVADMFETNDAAKGAGLAATQVGSRWRLFVYSCKDASGELRRGVVINPRLERWGPLDLDEETLEGCLSVPGEGFATARHRGARVTGTDLDGQEVVVEDEGGVLARCLQHEVDHLDGSLYLDRLSPARRREALDAVTARAWRARGILTWDPRERLAEEV
ncbi:peptide deformylase [Brachybacterium sp. NBEC-018]|uniref:Peptide deformylase n=1 Tax=Brachybacterium rhamnosum TaxID=173361 RepID=A0ABW4PVN1_9MICO|nr:MULTISPECIES: peptide deformylase [Brachybacterium]MCW1804626.1 peptide deformylase [Brachybacterium squillarum]QCR54615.1 peptide deformylase [Brachybacterium sp. SGAir0954]UVY83595.1 peptide deformylase [Brachybacterium sp. NBEC-018]